MKSLWASGSQDHFSRDAPRPRPQNPPEASAYCPCTGCQARPRIASWVSGVPDSQSATRFMRFVLVTTASTAAMPATPPASANQRPGIPATQSMTMTTAIMIMAVPRSWVSRTRPAVIPTGRAIAPASLTGSRSASRRRVSASASERTRATLAASDGCAVKPPRTIQFRLPLTVLPIPGTNTSSCRKADPRSAGSASRCQVRAGTRLATTRTTARAPRTSPGS